MDEIPYVSINGEDYLPRKEYEKIEKRKQYNQNFLFGLIHSTIVAGISTAHIIYAYASKQSLIETVKNSNLETLLVCGALFLGNLYYGYSNLSEAYQLDKELKNGEKKE